MTDIISQSYTGPDRRRAVRARVTDSQLGELQERVVASAQMRDMLDHRFAGFEARLQAGDDRMFRLEEAIDHNTRLTEQTATDSRETRDLMEMGKALFKAAHYFGRAVRWLGGIAAAAGAIWGLIYALTHSGRPPGGH